MTTPALRLLIGAVAIFCVPALDAGPVFADSIVIPQGRLERHGNLDVVYRLDAPATGEGILAIEWTDAHGRLVDEREMPVAFEDATDARFTLDLGRVAATGNRLRATLTLGGGAATEARANFFVPPADEGWNDYQVFIWQNQDSAQYAALRELGVSAGKVYADRSGAVVSDFTDPLLDNDLPWYVENIATDFYSAYHRWDPERPKNWRFLEARALYAANPLDPRALIRDPSLSDPAWLQTIRERLQGTVASYARFRPLFYNLADEPGIAQTASFWDFDMSPHSLAAMRDWLREEYGSLDALNAQWGSSFAGWDAVMPMTTREAVMREDDNYSAWADFKAWMDVAFARAVRAGTEAVHAADPTARAGLEGMQIPGWGGYDYSLLAHSVDVMEIYDYGENVETARSLNPGLVILNTSGSGGAREAYGVWRDFLRGSRGTILWDENRRMVGPDAVPGERGRQATRWIAALRGGVGALLIGAERHVDPIAMLYSPASQRTQWMLRVKPGGQAWSERDVDDEYEDNPIRDASARLRWAIEHMGLQHRMIAPAQIEQGALTRDGYRVLILPHAVALSPRAAAEIRRFVSAGGTVIAEGESGLFDAHSRRAAEPLLADLFPPGPAAAMRTVPLGRGRAIRLPDAAPEGGDMKPILAPIFAGAGVLPQFPLTRADGRQVGDVESYAFRNGDVTLLAFQRSPAIYPDADPARAAEAQAPLRLSLPGRFHVHDLLGGKMLGETDRLELTLDGVTPTILAIAPAPLPEPALSAPSELRQGETGMLRIGWEGASPAALHVVHLEVTDPAGRLLRHYSGNLLARGPFVTHSLPLALNDPIGTWRVRATDVISGRALDAAIEVVAR